MASVGASEPALAAGEQPANEAPATSAARARRLSPWRRRSTRLGRNGKDLQLALGAAEEALPAKQPALEVVVVRGGVALLAKLLPLVTVPVQQRHLVDVQQRGVSSEADA
jgi:hypothetical protein